MIDTHSKDRIFCMKLSKDKNELLQDLFVQYRIEGLTPKQSMEKAKAVLIRFKNN